MSPPGRPSKAMDERLRRRLELRRSSAAVPFRNRYRERKTGQESVRGFDWREELHDFVGEELWGAEAAAALDAYRSVDSFWTGEDDGCVDSED